MTLLAAVSRRALSPSAYDRDHDAVVRVRTVLLNTRSGALFVDDHVRVRTSARHPWPVLGDVLVERGEGACRAAALAASCPGALVVAVHHGPRCWMRVGSDGRTLVLTAGGPEQPEGFWETVASLAHSWLVAGLSAGGVGSTTGCRPPAHDPSGPPRSNRRSRERTASASSYPDRPTDA
ncbi:transcriptional regulator [Streptomyces ortus]|uniref:Transcriptional regulator n=1 Tax=Streptomyces ortus TaxID=2867268 RepID=A0ABT3V4Y4_9ACTN|nr:transcriptional regulator [Streptomyces ortus]MCX4235032.1 transcriptional regulator [Streptomyces ortus]